MSRYSGAGIDDSDEFRFPLAANYNQFYPYPPNFSTQPIPTMRPPSQANLPRLQLTPSISTAPSPVTSEPTDDGEEFSNEIDEEMLINEVRQEPAIWNTATNSYRNHEMRSRAWEKIAGKLGKTGRKYCI